jgi:hypothetical protein
MVALKTSFLLMALATTDPTIDFDAAYVSNPDATNTVILDAEFVPDVEFKNVAYDLVGVIAPSLDGACDNEKEIARAGIREVEDFLTRPNQRIILNFSGNVRQQDDEIIPLVYITALDNVSREDLATHLLDMGLVADANNPVTWCPSNEP